MSKAARPRPWTLSRRQVLGSGVAGFTGLVLGGLAESGCDSADSSTNVRGGPGAPSALTVDGLAHPIGLSPDDVFFAWNVTDHRRGAAQSAYRIVVSKVGGSGSSSEIWDSGRLSSSEQAFVPYGGPALDPDSVFRWTVQTWDAGGRGSAASQSGTFETGLSSQDWRASWITRTTSDARPDIYTYMRAERRLQRKTIARARMYVAGDQQYEAYVNGVRAGKGQAYCYADSQYCEALDVTKLLMSGTANAFTFVTTWDGPTKGHPAGRPGLIAQLSVRYSDGSSQTITSDGSWRVAQGAWLPGSQRDLEGDLVDFTENIDGPFIPLGWQQPGFDDSAWERATVIGPAVNSTWKRLLPVRTRITESPIAAQSLNVLSSGAVVVDFGKVYAAVPTVSFHQGTSGRKVQMRAGYLLDQAGPGSPPGTVSGQVSTVHGTQHTDMSYSYVQRGGEEQFHPFDYLGFRYFQIDDPGESLMPDDVVALTRHIAVPDENAATFSSSDPVVDSIFELGRHSALFTSQEQFIDTPTREKGPWLWDGFNASKTAMAAFGEQNSTRKSIIEFAESQSRYWPNGAVNKIYPTGLGAEDINEYTEIYPEWVWQYWMHTGDRSLLEAVYPAMVRLADYVHRSIGRSGLVTNLPSTNVYYSFPTVTRLNVLGANVFRRTAQAGQALGRPLAEVRTQSSRMASLRAAINRHLLRKDGIYVDGLNDDGSQRTTAAQDTNACGVVYGVAPAERIGTVADYVALLGMQAPPRTATEVLDSLAIANRDEDLARILTDANSDGWARILSLEGTFTWEVWEPSDANGDSMSHGWGSNVLVSIQRTLLGVSPTSPGFGSFEVKPPSTALLNAAGTVPTPRGPVEVSWTRATPSGAGFSLDVAVPPNSKATIRFPARGSEAVTESGVPLDRASGVRVGEAVDGRIEIETGAGHYNFQTD